MIGQLRVLLRVKELKEEQALRALQVKRAQVEEGRRAAERARAEVQESAATLPAREDAVYRAVIGRVVSLDDLDETRGQVVALEKAHGLLADASERAEHVLHRLGTELTAATGAWQASVRVRDKYGLLTEDLRLEIEAENAAREEAEVEELFARPRPRPGSGDGT